MENLFKKPKAAILINHILMDYEENRTFDFFGPTKEMAIYLALQAEGFLTESAMKPNEA